MVESSARGRRLTVRNYLRFIEYVTEKLDVFSVLSNVAALCVVPPHHDAVVALGLHDLLQLAGELLQVRLRFAGGIRHVPTGLAGERAPLRTISDDERVLRRLADARALDVGAERAGVLAVEREIPAGPRDRYGTTAGRIVGCAALRTAAPTEYLVGHLGRDGGRACRGLRGGRPIGLKLFCPLFRNFDVIVTADHVGAGAFVNLVPSPCGDLGGIALRDIDIADRVRFAIAAKIASIFWISRNPTRATGRGIVPAMKETHEAGRRPALRAGLLAWCCRRLLSGPARSPIRVRLVIQSRSAPAKECLGVVRHRAQVRRDLGIRILFGNVPPFRDLLAQVVGGAIAGPYRAGQLVGLFCRRLGRPLALLGFARGPLRYGRRLRPGCFGRRLGRRFVRHDAEECRVLTAHLGQLPPEQCLPDHVAEQLATGVHGATDRGAGPGRHDGTERLELLLHAARHRQALHGRIDRALDRALLQRGSAGAREPGRALGTPADE